MTPKQWNEALAPDQPWQITHEIVATEARKWLSENVINGDMVSTVTLVEGLYPAAIGKANEVCAKARQRIFYALKPEVAEHTLSDCMTRGAPTFVKWKREKIVPLLWHPPRNKIAEM